MKKTISLPLDVARQVEEIPGAEGKRLSAVVRDAVRTSRRARLERELREVQGHWSRVARERGLLTEGDLDRHLAD